MPTDTKLNQLIINQLTQEQYDEAKAAGTLSDTELYITDSDDEAQVKSNLSQIIDDSTTKYPSNKAVKDESSRITTLMDTKISNCITYIPQDIKLELNNGTLTLKAGSKVYIPNGAGVFDVVTIASDIKYKYTYAPSSDSFVMLFINQSGTAFVNSRLEFACFSGETQPSGNYINWYKTNENRMYSIGNNATIEDSGFSFPIARVIQGSDGVTKSIDQVFNGFGYIGSTVFALPGVKGLIPNGRNADGSLKSIEVVQNSVKIMTMASYMAGRKHCPLELFFNNELGGMAINFNNWGVVATLKDLPRDKLYAAYHCLEDNFVHYFNNTGVESIDKCLFAATFAVGDDNKITSFTPKTVFHALDYNDKSTISGWSMPSGRFIDLTLGASGSNYTAPANGFFFVEKVTQAVGQFLIFNTANMEQESIAVNAANWVGGFVPIKKGGKCKIIYTASGAVGYFRFIYAEGENS